MVDKESYLSQLEAGDTREESIKKAEKDVEVHEKLLRLLEQEVELHKKEFEIIGKNPRPKNPTFHYQEDDAYWELQKGYRDIQYERKMIEDEMSVERVKKVLQAKKEELARLKGDLV